MIIVWIVLALWAVALVVLGLRRRPRAHYAPPLSPIDTVQGFADRSRGERLTAGPYNQDDDGPDAA